MKFSQLKKLARLILGIVTLIATIWFFASGITPPGLAGEVLRHNQQNDIDASPLFYSEVEHMDQLEARARQLLKR